MRSVIKGRPKFKNQAEQAIFSWLLEREAIGLMEFEKEQGEIEKFRLQEIRKQLVFFVTSFGNFKVTD